MNHNTFTVLIADDEPLARDSINILMESVHDCQVIGMADNGREAQSLILTKEPDIVFMDIQMPHLLGTEVVGKFDNWGTPFFIFVTAFDDHAIKAFELNAVDYLLKPFTDERFYQSLKRAKDHVRALRLNTRLDTLHSERQKSFRQQFVVRSTGKIAFINTSEICYLRAAGNYVELITEDKKHLFRATISNLESELNPRDFVRIHRSTIVRKSEIKELQTYFNGEYIVIMRNGDQLKLSRSYKDNLTALT